MAHPFGSPNSSTIPYNSSAELDTSYQCGTSRVFLVAIQGGAVPPILRGRSPMQRMRVVVLSANQASNFESADLFSSAFQHALPAMPPALPMPRERRPQARLVRGEILRDKQGRLYEKIGEQIRPLHRLVSGSRGQVLELVPSQEPISEISVSAEVEATSPDSKKIEDENPRGPTQQHKQNGRSRQTGPVAQPAAENPKPAAYRKFFPDPGQRYIIRLGDFKSLLAPQLMHPERLRDTHRLACYLQIYEVTTAQRLESLAAAVLGDSSRVSQLQLMTESIAYQLGLTRFLRTRPRVPDNFPRDAGLLLPHERVFRLQLAQDPTADNPALTKQQPAANLPMRDPFTSAAGQGPAAAPKVSLKTVIPECYIKPWEFKLSRDEVLYDMNVTANFAGWFHSLNMRLKDWLSGRGELKKWKILLSGKSADDQLWTIRPPRGRVSHPAIRDWARKTLEAAGYDSSTMLLEWEIFWRRKGL